MRTGWLLGDLLVALPLYSAQASQTTGTDRKLVSTQSEMPRHTYPIASTAVKLLEDDDAVFNPWAAKVASDAADTLRNYDITDPAARETLLMLQIRAHLLAGQDAAALALVPAVRALQSKPDLRLVAAAREEEIALARIEAGARSGPAFDAAMGRALRAITGQVPFATVAAALRSQKTSFEINSPAVIRGYVATTIDRDLGTSRALDDRAAEALIRALHFEDPMARQDCGRVGPARCHLGRDGR